MLRPPRRRCRSPGRAPQVTSKSAPSAASQSPLTSLRPSLEQEEDATMTTTQTTTNVEQWRLPRQAAAPEGPVDVKMMYVMHHAFRRDLVMFAEAAAATPADDREVWQGAGGAPAGRRAT